MRRSVLGCVPKLKIYPDKTVKQEIGKEMLNGTGQTERGLFSVCESRFLEGDPEDPFLTSIFTSAKNHLIVFDFTREAGTSQIQTLRLTRASDSICSQ